jgi:hypothetical protein
VATAVAIAAVGGIDDRLEPGHQADVALRFVKLLQLGAYESAIELADHNWLRCRVYAWLWNKQSHFGSDTDELARIAADMLQEREASKDWNDFVSTEAGQFRKDWGPIDFDQYGIAGHRRRVARDLDLVILAPVGESGGYFVTEATAIVGAFTLLVRKQGSSWLVANHVSIAPPLAEWPPIWWGTGDSVVETLPEA